MVTIKISGPDTRVAAGIIEHAFASHGLKVCTWFDCVPRDRKPQADARKEDAAVLIMRMRYRAP